MIEEIKLMLGAAVGNYTDAQIALALRLALSDIEVYCKRPIDAELELVAMRMAVVRLNRINTEGLTAQAYSGVSESYLDGYPEDIQMILRGKRKIKVV